MWTERQIMSEFMTIAVSHHDKEVRKFAEGQVYIMLRARFRKNEALVVRKILLRERKNALRCK